MAVKKFWTMKDGSKIRIADMQDGHLNNTIRMLKTKNLTSVCANDYKALCRELQRREKAKKGGSNMIEALKRFDIDGMSIESLVELSIFARQFETELAELKVEKPEWFDGQVKILRREIQKRQADKIDARIRELEARQEALKSADEKRKAIADELEKLRALQA